MCYLKEKPNPKCFLAVSRLQAVHAEAIEVRQIF